MVTAIQLVWSGLLNIINMNKSWVLFSFAMKTYTPLQRNHFDSKTHIYKNMVLNITAITSSNAVYSQNTKLFC